MFVKMKGNHHTGLYLSGIFKTLLPRRDRATIYEIPDADALPAIEAGLYVEVPKDKVKEFFGVGVDAHSGYWTWEPQTK
jgi:hypothetical protein